ncbi:Outer membrane usher protein FanD [Frankliniella fusca]|uniref:Outer membrane usher protein FanD n=1 Tax=Frankliniella fusca TaxID=407009 RepID=A0AAE1I0K6_9NEOP|nr:Outer membrane usher protein FanD [Frankliniella fusca]
MINIFVGMSPTVSDVALPRSEEFLSATKRLKDVLPTRLLLEKSWRLNKSSTKIISMGLRLDHQIDVCAVLSGSSGQSVRLRDLKPGNITVRLSQNELCALLNPRWAKTVMGHFSTPRVPGAVQVLESCEMRCIVHHADLTPSLKISRSGDGHLGYVLLAEISVKTLFALSEHLHCYMNFLKSYAVECDSWLVNGVRKIKSLGDEMQISFESEKDVMSVLSFYGRGLTSCEALTPEKQFLLDLTFSHREQFARCVIDYVHQMSAAVSDPVPDVISLSQESQEMDE